MPRFLSGLVFLYVHIPGSASQSCYFNTLSSPCAFRFFADSSIGTYSDIIQEQQSLSTFFFFLIMSFIFLYLLLLRAAPMAYGGS